MGQFPDPCDGDYRLVLPSLFDPFGGPCAAVAAIAALTPRVSVTPERLLLARCTKRCRTIRQCLRPDLKRGCDSQWLHIGSKEAGPKIAAIFSIVETCRKLGVPIRQYLAHITA